MDQVYRISGQRLEGIGDQVRRLGNSTEKLTPAQMQQLLEGVTLGAGSSLIDAEAVGNLPVTVKGSGSSVLSVLFITGANGHI